MTLFEEAAADLKNSIRSATNSALDRFKTCTGVMPSRIHIEMIETTTATSRCNEYVIGHVEIEIKV